MDERKRVMEREAGRVLKGRYNCGGILRSFGEIKCNLT
jgi:hypothetical protein